MLDDAADRRFKLTVAILLAAIAGSGSNGCRSTKMERRAAEYNKNADLARSYFANGDLDRAEEMYRKVLDLEEQMGSKAGVAHSYYHIGKVYAARGDRDGARGYFARARLLLEKVGLRENAAWVQKAIEELDQCNKPNPSVQTESETPIR